MIRPNRRFGGTAKKAGRSGNDNLSFWVQMLVYAVSIGSFGGGDINQDQLPGKEDGQTQRPD